MGLGFLQYKERMSADRTQDRLNFREKPIRELEEELRTLKEKEKYYIKLSQKVKDLQEKSKRIKRASDEIVNENFDDQQIEKLKTDIDRTLTETKRIEEDNKVIKEQTKSLENQLKALENVYNNICSENKTRRQRIQLRDEQLVQKENEVESLIERRNCNELVTEELRIQITRLQDEQSELKAQLEALRMQRHEEEREKERLRGIVTECKKEISEQERHSQQHRIKIAQIREANYIVKEELLALLKMEEKLKSELDHTIQTYNKTVALNLESQNKLQSLQDELHHVEQDLKILTDEYLRQNEVLREEEEKNQQLNREMDQLAKEVLSVWQSVRELTEMQEEGNPDLKTKAYKAWIELSQILGLR